MDTAAQNTQQSMFDTLVDIPLFRGVTRERMAQTVGSTRFHFLKYAPGETVVDVGQPCTHIRFVISGAVRVTIANSDDRFRISQTLQAPDVISPDFLFGLTTVYPGRAVAVGETSVVEITKNDYMKILGSDHIFMYNLLNYLSMNAQKCVEGVLAMTGGSIEERLAMWVVALTQPTARNIEIVCRQRDLYAMFGVQRTSFVAALDHLRQSGAITYQPGVIQVTDRRKMLEVMKGALE